MNASGKMSIEKKKKKKKKKKRSMCISKKLHMMINSDYISGAIQVYSGGGRKVIVSMSASISPLLYSSAGLCSCSVEPYPGKAALISHKGSMKC